MKLDTDSESIIDRKPDHSRTSPEVSIIILTWNALDFTRKCLESIESHTAILYEIIFVDNGSTDGTIQFLEDIVSKNRYYRLIRNSENKGFAAGNNQGSMPATGEYLLFLNNDVLVADGWIKSLLTVMKKSQNIGMVGPITNNISGRQSVKKIPYKDPSEYYKYADKVRVINHHKFTPRRRIAGFAVLMRKALFHEIGGFDESFGIGNFEDDDLCLRVKQKQLAIMVDESTFIHHYGSQTFKANKIDYIATLKERGERFVKKWPNVDYEELIELKNPLTDTHPELMKAGQQYLAQKNYSDALIYFEEVYLENPLDIEALHGIAICQFNNSHEVAAMITIKNILQQSPYHAPTYHLAGIVSMKLAKWESAESLFMRAIKIDPGLTEAQYHLSDVYYHLKEFGKASDILAGIIKNNSQDTKALKLYTKVLKTSGQKNRNLEIKETLAQVNNNDKQKLSTIAGKNNLLCQLIELREQSEYEKAINILNQAPQQFLHSSENIPEIVKILVLTKNPDLAMKFLSIYQEKSKGKPRIEAAVYYRLKFLITDDHHLLSVSKIDDNPPNWLRHYLKTGKDILFDTQIRSIEINITTISNYRLEITCGSCNKNYTLTLKGTILISKKYFCPHCLSKQILTYNMIMSYMESNYSSLTGEKVIELTKEVCNFGADLNNWFDKNIPRVARNLNLHAVFLMNQLILENLWQTIKTEQH